MEGWSGVFYWYRGATNITILISDIASGVCVDSHSINGAIPLSNDIWTYGGSLRFATADATTITIWEVEFTSGATPTEVEILPIPDGFEPTLLPQRGLRRHQEEVSVSPRPMSTRPHF